MTTGSVPAHGPTTSPRGRRHGGRGFASAHPVAARHGRPPRRRVPGHARRHGGVVPVGVRHPRPDGAGDVDALRLPLRPEPGTTGLRHAGRDLRLVSHPTARPPHPHRLRHRRAGVDGAAVPDAGLVGRRRAGTGQDRPDPLVRQPAAGRAAGRLVVGGRPAGLGDGAVPRRRRRSGDTGRDRQRTVAGGRPCHRAHPAGCLGEPSVRATGRHGPVTDPGGLQRRGLRRRDGVGPSLPPVRRLGVRPRLTAVRLLRRPSPLPLRHRHPARRHLRERLGGGSCHRPPAHHRRPAGARPDPPDLSSPLSQRVVRDGVHRPTASSSPPRSTGSATRWSGSPSPTWG